MLEFKVKLFIDVDVPNNMPLVPHIFEELEKEIVTQLGIDKATILDVNYVEGEC